MRVETKRQTTVTVNLMGLTMEQARRLRNTLRYTTLTYACSGQASCLAEVFYALERATQDAEATSEA